jgi:type II secretory pathway pseudopilin PulG
MEVAISLAVLGILMAAVIMPLVTQIQQRNVSVTEKALGEIKDALLGFAAVNGRLPCPSTLASLGAEAFDVANGGNPANGRCASFWGFVPARTLGITPVDTSGFVIDGWGSANNRIRYAVSSATVGTVDRAFTTTDGVRTATLAQVATLGSLLIVCNSGVGVTPGVSCNSATTLADNAVVVIWSVGPNASTGGTGTDEAQNPNPGNETGDRIFVSRPASDNVANPFDDIVTWTSINTLVNRMVAAGQLP